MIHTDGKPTIASGTRGHRLAAVFGIKPEIVEDAIQREASRPTNRVEREMNFAARRAFTCVRENIDNGEIKSLAQCYVFVAQMEASYASRS